ncbi:MAG: hypothetical protein ACF8R7_16180 [Phycisphaerales bacterium JB039]
MKGRLKDTAPGINPNNSIVHFTYDALGRLIARQAPWPGLPGEIRTEIYKHDGVRRIQETWRDPVTGNGSQGGQNQNGGGGPVTYADTTEREYVHSPGYVDELVCEIDTGGPSDTFWWAPQDANYNVVALVSDGDGSLLRGQVARQYAWSPYGELLRADVFDSAAPMSRLGHQGLFHDRLDAGVTSEPMAAFSTQLVQNRNRTLSPRLGRYLQRDPNGSGLPTPQSQSATRTSPFVDAATTFTDGLSLFIPYAGNPVNYRDAYGLTLYGSFGAANSIRTDLSGKQGEAGQALLDVLRNTLVLGISVEQAIIGAVAETITISFAGRAFDGALDLPGVRLGARGPVAPRLTARQADALRSEAREIFRIRTGITADWHFHVHHRIPLEWSHLFPLNPNHITNLHGVPRAVHTQINNRWTAFRTVNRGRMPSAQEVLEHARLIDLDFGHMMRPAVGG